MMNNTVWTTLNGLQTGGTQTQSEMTVLALLDPVQRRLRYVTVSEALESGTLTITEVSESGSVPQLDADNAGGDPVLLFDGEEVAGAKQNRVLNTSILVPAKSKIRIPVSCTEQGRWSYRSRRFSPSGNIMAAKMRARKMAYVSASLEEERSYRGNQGKVWEDVDELHMSLGSASPTRAMSDAYRGRGLDIHRLAKSFKAEDGQVGIAVALEGRFLGLDYVSSSSAFSEVFPKLIRSYALEGLDGRRRATRRPTRQLQVDPEADLLETVRNLLLDADSTTESQHRSVGMGRDYRYKSANLVGTALVAEGEVVHLGLLSVELDP